MWGRVRSPGRFLRFQNRIEGGWVGVGGCWWWWLWLMCWHCGCKGAIIDHNSKCPMGKSSTLRPSSGAHMHMYRKWVNHDLLCCAWGGGGGGEIGDREAQKGCSAASVTGALPLLVSVRGSLMRGFGKKMNEALGVGVHGVWDGLNNLTRKLKTKCVYNLPPVTLDVWQGEGSVEETVYTLTLKPVTSPDAHGYSNTGGNSFSRRVFICKSRFSYGMRRRPSPF